MAYPQYSNEEEIAKQAWHLCQLFEALDCDTLFECDFVDDLMKNNCYFLAYQLNRDISSDAPLEDIKEEIEYHLRHNGGSTKENAEKAHRLGAIICVERDIYFE